MSEYVRLGDVFSLIRNGASIKQIDGAGGYPITRIETISNRIVDRKKFGYADIEDISKYDDYILQDGDILMSHINSEQHLGKVALYKKQPNETIIHGMNLLALRANSEIIFPDYASYFFNSYSFKNQIPRITKKSVNQASFTVTALNDLTIPVPTIERQKYVVNVLDKVTALINNHKKQLEKLDELVKARFVEMFGEPVANPMKWDINLIRNIVNEVRYGTSRPAVENGKYPYLRMNNITYEGELDLSDIKYIDIPDNELDKCTVKRGDVLFNRTNSKELVGKTCVYNRDEPMVLAGFVIRIRLKEIILPEFLSAFLNADFSKRTLFEMCKTAIGQANINAQELQNIKIYVPPISLQNDFVEIKRKTDIAKAQIRQSLDKLETLKKSLMQKYFG